MKTVVINLYGGPGSGKSTLAAGLFYELKKLGINCELIQEYVKKWAWQGILPNALDQFYISGKQTKAEQMLYGKVRFIVTDCPLYMGAFYEQKYNSTQVVEPALREFHLLTKDLVERKHFLVQRNKKYNPEGRFCSEESALQTDTELKVFLETRSLPVVHLEGSLDEQLAQLLKEVTVNNK